MYTHAYSSKTIAFAAVGALAVLAALVGPGAAQPAALQYGDLIVSGYSSVSPGSTTVLAYHQAARRFTTLHREMGNEIFQWVGMLDDNRNIALLSLDRAAGIGKLYGVSPSGSAQVLGSIRGAAQVVPDPTGAVWGPQGRLLIAAGDGLYRFDPAAPNTIAPVFRFPPSPMSTLRPALQSVAVGPGPTGSFRVNYYALNALPTAGSPSLNPPFVYRFDPLTNRFTSFVTNKALLEATSISFRHFRPSNAPMQLLVTRGRTGTSSELLRVDLLSGALRTISTFRTFIPAAHKVTRRGTAWVVGETGLNQPPSVMVDVDLRNGTIIRTLPIPNPAGFRATGVEVYGTNLLHLTGTALGGDSPLLLWLETGDPTLAGKSYILALSLGNAPPTPLTVSAGTVYLNLAPDWLFFLSAFVPSSLPWLTGSQGVLDANGNAQASLSVPSSWNTGGLVIYAAWVVYDTNAVLRVSETELFVLP